MSQYPNTDDQGQAIKPWYKQFWLWFLVSIPLTSVILSSIMVTVAVRGKDSLVSDDYYKDGLEINQERHRDQLAHELGLSGSLQADMAHEQLQLRLDSSSPLDEPLLILKLIHPTLHDQDHLLQLNRVGDHYEGSWPAISEGRWYIDLRDPGNRWRLRGELVLPSSEPARLTDDAA